MPSASFRSLQPRVVPCRSCKAPIFWASVLQTRKRMPINAASRVDGNIVLVDPGTCLALGPIEAAESKARKYVSHFVTCPDAKAWRRARALPDPPAPTREELPCPSPNKS